MYLNSVKHKAEKGSDLEKVYSFIDSISNRPRIYSDLGKYKSAAFNYKKTCYGMFLPPSDEIIIHQSRCSEKQEAFTILHELGHWTGHKKRLNRYFLATYGYEKVSLHSEEMVADIFTIRLAQMLSLDTEFASKWMEWTLEHYSEADLPMAYREAELAVEYILSRRKKV